jgi:propionyl-CoA carboxylase alpha chain
VTKYTDIQKVLIANRGEIALRIIRTLKKMGIKSVAVYSEADTYSLHVQLADEAVYIGHSPATESYLHIPHILDAIRKTGAQAVHPGYGFLSENAKFAQALKKAGVNLIGPSIEAIQKMGDKIEAKKIAIESGVSTIPGYMGVIANAEEAIKIANDIGFPIIIKAAAGGGGRGMRVIYNTEDVAEAFRSASSEARNSFSDERVFIEKFVEDPRHIEIQVLADKHGNIVCLGERECSIQRHHQKVIEEAPSSFIDEVTRQKMYDQCISLVKKVGYYSAGTVEFIIDKDKNFYFLEMNTRLQVEHCVTELITNVDLVEQMVRVARGEKLELKQEDVKLEGWAFESRIYAEDPARGFLPSSGRITQYREPQRSNNVRVDSGIYEGGEVSMFYDAMVSKLCTYAPTRMEAIEHMQKSLGEYVIRGISHNISFLEAIMANPKFQSGDISTKFIENEYPDGFLGAELTSEITKVFLCVGLHIYMEDAKRAAQTNGKLRDRERQIGTRWVIGVDDNMFPVVIRDVEGGYNIRFEGARLSIRSNWVLGDALLQGTVNDKIVNVKIEDFPGGYYLNYAGVTSKVIVRSPRVAELEKFMPVSKNNEKPRSLNAPLAGSVVAIKVEKGDEIKIGQEVAIIEAMKMENIIIAVSQGIVGDILVKQGDSVSANQILMEIEYND